MTGALERMSTIALAMPLATLLAIVTPPPTLGAQSAATVLASDATYDRLEQLVAFGAAPRVTLWERPLSRREVARIALAADGALRAHAGAPARARAIVAELLDAYADEARELREGASARGMVGRPLEEVRGELLSTDAVPFDLPAQNGVGRIAATVDPLLERRYGRLAPEGVLQAVETAHRVGVGGWLALGARPRLDVVERTGAGTTTAIGSLPIAYARLRVANVALEVGPDERTWGAGVNGGMFIASSVRPLPALSLASDTAFRLPWFLGRLGPARAVLLVADLGAQQTFPHAKLAGWSVSFAPSDRVAFGASLLDHMGGFGAPPSSLGGRIADMFPFVDWLVRPEKDRESTNKLAGGDLRIRIPEWRGAELYWEFEMDDFEPKRLPGLLWDDTGELLGLRVQRLTSEGTLGATVEYHRTSIRLYEHGQFTNGVTYRRDLVGDPLGPNAAGLYGALTWRPDARTTVALRPEYEQRNPSVYRIPDQSHWTFAVTSERAREIHRRAVVEMQRETIGAGLGLLARVGYERVSNLAYRGGASGQSFVQVAARYRF